MITFKWLKIALLTQACILHAQSYAVENDLDLPKIADNSSLYRLPTKIRPISYNITLLTNVTRSDFTYKGSVIIDLRVLNDTNEIVLHADKLKINQEKSTLEKKGTEACLEKWHIDSQNYNNETQFFTIILASHLTPGVYQLTLHFDGEVLDDLFGFYRSSYKVDNQVRWMGVTQFSPTFARRAFPCMDEPGFKATFQLNIGHYSNETVTSNMFAESRDLVFADRKLGDYYMTHFARTPRMSTYLVGWAIHGCNRANSTKLHMWLWSRLQNLKSNQNPILVEGPLIEAALETYTAMANPVRKFEQLAIPDFYFSAMENWGMVTYRESLALVSYDSTPHRTIFRLLETQAHEYSHSYFGNLVTPSFWDVAWLKEGFATYFAYLSLGNLHEDWRMMEIFAVTDLQSALLSDSEPEQKRTMNGRAVGSASSALSALDFVTYGKGASIIRMFADVLGEKPFKRAMQSYLRRRQYESVVPKDLYDELQLVANGLPASIEVLFDSWTNQTHYPLVQVSRNQNQVTLSQRSFDLNNTASTSHWWIPITILTPTNESELNWLANSNQSLTVPLPKQTAWFVVNPHLSGYYRVDYEMENWQALIALLHSESLESLPSLSRAALVDDAFNLARAGLRNYSLPLSVAAYLKRERDYVPWITASRIILLLDERLKDQEVARKAFRSYATDLIAPIYRELTEKQETSESLIKKMHREVVLFTACSIDFEPCVSMAKSIFDRWIANGNETIPASFKNFIFTIGIIKGNDQDWENLWRRFLQTDSYPDKIIMISALAYTENSSFINKFLEFAIEPHLDIARQYRLTIVQSILGSSSKNLYSTLKYVEDNLSKIISLRGIQFVDKILSTYGQQVTNLDQKQKLMTFLNDNAKILGTALETGKAAIKTADANMKWINRCATEVLKYIDSNSEISSST